MYRIMLIDDEPSARNLLRAAIDTELLNMEVVGEAGSGIEAINIIDDIRPDIVFADISMPFMNGIEFTEVVSNRYPDLVIIIMTALDDFRFAQKCVSLPVFEYMLKPIVKDEVCGVLLKVKEKLDAVFPKKKASSEGEESDLEDYENESAERAGSDNSSICKITEYIKNNYKDSTINLASTAQTFGFSSSYLSRKFKQEIGKNFVEYLTECRMERAIELAKQNNKMFVTSKEVGIPDPNYFGKCFKKATGMSYSEFVAAQK